uniref:Uncharacterized protein n=1 Tax=Rhizophora mucronata TaxID=61149 RepID=A0A2P2J2E5_RHIMU
MHQAHKDLRKNKGQSPGASLKRHHTLAIIKSIDWLK